MILPISQFSNFRLCKYHIRPKPKLTLFNFQHHYNYFSKYDNNSVIRESKRLLVSNIVNIHKSDDGDEIISCNVDVKFNQIGEYKQKIKQLNWKDAHLYCDKIMHLSFLNKKSSVVAESILLLYEELFPHNSSLKNNNEVLNHDHNNNDNNDNNNNDNNNNDNKIEKERSQNNDNNDHQIENTSLHLSIDVIDNKQNDDETFDRSLLYSKYSITDNPNNIKEALSSLYSKLIQYYSTVKKPQKVIALYNKLKSKELPISDDLAIVFIKSISSRDYIDVLQNVKREMEERNSILVYKTLISTFCKQNLKHSVEELFENMKAKEIEPDAEIFSKVMSVNKTNLKRIISLVSEMKRCKIRQGLEHYKYIVYAYSVDDPETARNFLEEMQNRGIQPTLSCYNSVIRGFAASKDTKSALSLLLEMKKKMIQPDGNTYAYILKCYRLNSDWNSFKRLLTIVKNEKVTLTPSFYSVYISTLIKRKALSQQTIIDIIYSLKQSKCDLFALRNIFKRYFISLNTLPALDFIISTIKSEMITASFVSSMLENIIEFEEPSDSLVIRIENFVQVHQELFQNNSIIYFPILFAYVKVYSGRNLSSKLNEFSSTFNVIIPSSISSQLCKLKAEEASLIQHFVDEHNKRLATSKNEIVI